MQSRQGLTYLALMFERFDVSDSAGAAIASAVLKDFEVIDNSAEGIGFRQFSRRYMPRFYFETVWTAFFPCQFCSCDNLCKTARFVGRTPSEN